MSFGSNKKANFLHALNSDKQKGILPSQALAAPMAGMKPPMQTSAMMNPMVHVKPVPMTHIPQPAAPKSLMQQNNVPSLPGLNKLPKFAKTRNSLKSEFKTK